MLLEDSLLNKKVSIKQLLLKKNITGIQFDSRQIEPGNLFIAIEGTSMDGHQYIQQAIERGASVIIGEKNIEGLQVPYYKSFNSRLALSKAASEFYGHPWERPIMIGITGTNGKTTTSYFIRHILEHHGLSCGLIGTVKHIINGNEIFSSQTTPDPIQLQKLLSESKDDVIIMEVSSHGLHQDRVSGIEFDFALFTNLSHDHLDYHTTIESYFYVKAKLFNLLKEDGLAIIGTYNNWGDKMRRVINTPDTRVFTFGSNDYDDYELLQWNQGSINKCLIRDIKDKISLVFPLPGLHNVWNALGSFVIARKLNISVEEIKHALLSFPGVPGRFQMINYENQPTFIVDYAHTPDGLEHCLSTAKKQSSGELIHIFGFRGNRDKTKRETMLEISTSKCNKVILTLDDLNTESYNSMIEDMRCLAERRLNVQIIPDRTLAIERAWKEAGTNDIVIITGKGPEEYKQPFTHPCLSDQDTVNFLVKESIDNDVQVRHLH
ncbi:UDP-N-acetylmuramoyl-L-alanyl-D-glutamate--2,6-diaminopimelate ligase [Litchfieldia alkalitelluris]|uniref:UDP-N-acetylmuramoyl-L-alanyl-D-glutamate--2, 6-diaminopimelate ligase n=1 Tax=Litchfieldia alkalitelluris TaxID=304268 RepID=UPI000997ECFC|nr:UDP-N-acetylmuramoyl-L-alanyl-D-glutamate--2,6-diaminopimelate ligase [Litchfieldia alkalitelluris]